MTDEPQETPTNPTPEPERILVRVIEEQGKSALVQTDDFRRYYAPTANIEDGAIAQGDLDQCPYYGIQWEAYLGMDSITTETLASMLRQAGIYTLDDLRDRDRQLIRIGTNLIGRVVRDAAQRAAEAKPPRSE